MCIVRNIKLKLMTPTPTLILSIISKDSFFLFLTLSKYMYLLYYTFFCLFILLLNIKRYIYSKSL